MGPPSPDPFGPHQSPHDIPTPPALAVVRLLSRSEFRHRGICMQHRQRIKQYIIKNFLFSNDDNAIGDRDSLVRGGILDSTGIYELIMYIEEEYKFTIAPEEMIPDNFDTLEVIDAFIERKLAG
jgi:acyl carrier protein